MWCKVKCRLEWPTSTSSIRNDPESTSEKGHNWVCDQRIHLGLTMCHIIIFYRMNHCQPLIFIFGEYLFSSSFILSFYHNFIWAINFTAVRRERRSEIKKKLLVGFNLTLLSSQGSLVDIHCFTAMRT